jgi:hypothetical protein
MFHYTGSDRELPFLPLTDFDWEKACLFPMPLGVSVILFRYRDQWLLSSSHNNFFAKTVKERFRLRLRCRESADVATNSDEERWNRYLAHIFWRLWKENNYTLPSPEDKLCYMFRVVFDDPLLAFPLPEMAEDISTTAKLSGRIVLVGVRNQITFDEKWPQPVAERYGWSTVTESTDVLHTTISSCFHSFPSSSSMSQVKKLLRALLDKARELSLLDYSGYVLCDPSFKRIVLPSPQYQVLASLRPFISRYVCLHSFLANSHGK